MGRGERTPTAHAREKQSQKLTLQPESGHRGNLWVTYGRRTPGMPLVGRTSTQGSRTSFCDIHALMNSTAVTRGPGDTTGLALHDEPNRNETLPTIAHTKGASAA